MNGHKENPAETESLVYLQVDEQKRRERLMRRLCKAFVSCKGSEKKTLPKQGLS